MSRVLITAVAASLLLAIAAHADERGEAQVAVELGVAAFDRDLAGRVAPGPAWGLWATVPLRPALSVMIGYFGASTRIDDPTASGRLSSNAGYAAARLGVPPDRRLRAYAFAGFGLMRTNVPESARAQFHPDTAAILPAGVGVELSISRRFALGGRFTYDIALDNELEVGGGTISADLWSGTVTGALRF